MIKSLTEAQYSIFMTMLDGIRIRDRCILLFMLHGGLRNGEVCKLNWSDVCIDREVFHTIRIINGHSRKKDSRYVALTPKLVESLQDYILWCDHNGVYQDADLSLFVTRNLRIRMQQRDLQRIVANYTMSCLREAYTPHSLRHTFATRCLRCSNIRVVQQLLGHSSLTSTQVYTHPTSDDRSNAINQAF